MNDGHWLGWMEQVNNSHPTEKQYAHETNHSLQSFKQFYLEHFSFVLRNAQRFGIQPEEAEDVAQEVFITAHRLRHLLRKNVSGKAWLYGITRRIAAGRRRTRNRRTRKLQALATIKSSLSTLNFSDQFHDGQLVEYLLEQIDKEKQEVFVLAELFDMSGQEIAHALGIKVSTGASRLRLARTKFRELVAQYEPEQTTLAQAALLSQARAQQRVSNTKTLRSWTIFVAAIVTPTAPACSAAILFASHNKLAPVWHISVSLTATFTLLWNIGTALQAPESAAISKFASTTSGCSTNQILGSWRDSDEKNSEGVVGFNVSSKKGPLSASPMGSKSTQYVDSTASGRAGANRYSPVLNALVELFQRENGATTIHFDQSSKPESSKDLSGHQESSPIHSCPATPRPEGVPPTGDSTLPSPEVDEIPSRVLAACSEYCNRLDACRPPWGDCNDRCVGQYEDAVASDSICEEPFLALNECVHASTCTEIKDYIAEINHSYPCQSLEMELKICKGIPVEVVASNGEQLIPGL